MKSRDLVICALLAVSGATLPVSNSRAGMLDLLRPKRPASTARRGQSPDAAYSAASTAAPVWQSGDQSGPQTAYSGSAMPTGWGYDSSPCFNCGNDDHFQWYTRHCRKRCHQTWYPRLAPYCLAGWAWTQPCWRRPVDNYNCPRPEAPLTRSPPAAPPLAPSAEPSPPPPPQPPAVPTTTVTPTSHSSLARQAPGNGRGGQTVPPRQAPQIQPEATRFTSFADTLEPDQEADEEEEVGDTLQLRMEAADAGEDAEVAASDSEMEASDAETEAGDADAESAEEDESEPPAIEE